MLWFQSKHPRATGPDSADFLSRKGDRPAGFTVMSSPTGFSQDQFNDYPDLVPLCSALGQTAQVAQRNDDPNLSGISHFQYI